jgi:hypothetical protein
MKILPIVSKHSLIVSLAMAGLLIGACSPSVKTTTQVSPTQKSTGAAAQATTQIKPTEPIAKSTAAPEATTSRATPIVSTPESMSTDTAQGFTLAKLPKLGEVQKIGNLEVIPSDAEFVREFDDTPARDGYQYLVLSLTIKNVSPSITQDFDISHLWIGQPGGELLPALIGEQFTRNLESAQIKPGASTQGEVIFEIPDHGAEWYLQLQGENHQVLNWSLEGVG